MQNTDKNALVHDTYWNARGFKTEAERHHRTQNLPTSPQKQA